MTRVGAGCELVGMGCVQINGEDGDGWAYGCSGVAASQGVAERHQILRCRFLFRGLFFLGLPLSNPILRLARTALCRRRTSRVQILASAMRREAWRRMLTEQTRARAAAARVLVAGRSLALPKLLAPRAGHCFVGGIRTTSLSGCNTFAVPGRQISVESARTERDSSERPTLWHDARHSGATGRTRRVSLCCLCRGSVAWRPYTVRRVD